MQEKASPEPVAGRSRFPETISGCHHPRQDPAGFRFLKKEKPQKHRHGETMKTDHQTRPWPICLVILMILSAIATAGCLDSSQEPQSGVTSPGGAYAKPPATGTTITTRIATESVTQTLAQPASAPVSSTGVIRVDPITDKNTGEKFTLTGTTSLPAGTNILWQIMPDTGTPPTGLDGSSMMSVGGNYLVADGDGTSNRISLSIDLGRLVPGKYVAIVGKMKGDETSGTVFEIGKDYGYTFFTVT
jgi:hypothetical protein